VGLSYSKTHSEGEVSNRRDWTSKICSLTFEMDDLGNRMGNQVLRSGTVSFTAEALTNRYTDIGGAGVPDPVHDDAGNLTTDHRDYTYTYDYENRIIKIEKPDGPDDGSDPDPVAEDGYREVLGIAEGCKEDKAGWSGFLAYLKKRGLRCPELFISDKCIGLIESLAEYYPEAKWQRCTVHWYRNVLSVVPRGKMREVAAMLKAIHAQEDTEAARIKAAAVIEKLKAMKLSNAADKVAEGVDETLTYYAFPREHHRHIYTNNPLEAINRQIRRRTRVVGAFPDGNSALMLAAARLRHITGTQWGLKRYMNMDRLKELRREQLAVLEGVAG